MYRPLIENFLGIGTACVACHEAGRQIPGLACIYKAVVGVLGNAVEICPICDQHPEDAPDWL
jgi:hypothetical protein